MVPQGRGGNVARGVSQQEQTQATTAENSAAAQQQQNAQLQAQNQSQFNDLQQNYQNILQNPGYTPAQQSSITNATMGSLGATYDSLKNQANLTAARTRNQAGYSSLLDSLAQNQGSQAASLAAKNQTNFANDAQSQQNMALSGMSKLYGVNTGLLQTSLGLPAGYLNSANSSLSVANQPSPFQQTLNSIVGGVTGGIGQGVGKAVGGKI